ncbi:hypothetical protein ACQQ2Q_17955 [Agrobacterium sp. ES01]|uniref:hypothetical protein n=1 Tax=Agrobacterium sp. ES01 TaxID=3420714 RepID=UPI003D0FD10A
MKIIKVLTVVALVSIPLTSAFSEHSSVYLFLDEETAETKFDGLNVMLRAELSDKDQKERDFARTPRVWITCQDSGRQIMSIDTADDLDPWPSITDDQHIEVDSKLISQTGAFPDLATRMSASRRLHLLDLNIDITGRAEDVARSWLQGFPIKLTAAPGGDLSDLDLVIFPGSSSAAFRTQVATLVRACEILAET